MNDARSADPSWITEKPSIPSNRLSASQQGTAGQRIYGSGGVDRRVHREAEGRELFS
jgi:hypothetical protein